MTTKHIQIFVDLEKQENYFEQKVFVRGYDDRWPWPSMDEVLKKNTDKHYVRSTTKTKVNSNHEYFKQIAELIDLNPDLYNQIRNFYDYVMIYEFDFFELTDSRKNIIFSKEETDLYRIKREIIAPTDDKVFYVVKVSPILHDHAIMALFQCDSKNVFLPKTKFDKKDYLYRLYNNDRLLIERFWPSILPGTKSLVEDFWIEVISPLNFKITSKANLVITKIIVDQQVFYPNSNQFSIEP